VGKNFPAMPKFCATLLLGVAALLAKEETPKLSYHEYHGLFADDPALPNGLRNPERGFRLECPIGLGEGQLLVQRADGRIVRKRAPAANDEKPVPCLGVDVARNGWSDRAMADAIKAWEAKGVTSYLGLVWLDEYCNRPLDPILLTRLERSLDVFRRAGVKLQIRFAYELDDSKTAGPDLAILKGHWVQLKPLLAKNYDILTAVQLGCIGRRGEGPNATRLPADVATHAALLRDAFSALPPDRALLIQSPTMREDLFTELKWPTRLNQGTAFEKGNPSARTGQVNANFLVDMKHGGQFEADIGGANAEWQKMCAETLWVPYDADLSARAAEGKVAADGWLVAQAASNERATTLGLSHGWSESSPDRKEGIVDGWKKQLKTKAEVKALGLSVSDGYFTDSKGNEVPRSAFDYLRDHVGYRYELLSASWPVKVKQGKDFEIKLRLVNRGFAICPTPRGLSLAYVQTPQKYTLAPGEGESFDIRRVLPNAALQNTETGQEITIRAIAPKDIQGKHQLCVIFPELNATKFPYKQDQRNQVRFANRDAAAWQSNDRLYQGSLLGEIDVVR
jgi:hypothetical protein